MKKLLTGMLVFTALSACGFSAYENYLLSGRQTHVMLFAIAKDGQAGALQAALKKVMGQPTRKAFEKVKISNLSSYTKKLQDKPCVMVYFDYDGMNYLEAVKAFESLPLIQDLRPLLSPHPRAEKQGTAWLQMEWINFIQGAKPSLTPKRFAMVTRVKPEKEAEYRLLHQSTWPGTVDRMTRMEYHDFSIFLVELGDEIYEMFYVEFAGADTGKDKMSSVAEPAYERWIKQTDSCQKPLPDADGIWSAMEKTSEKE
ncbi:MAG: L-rhamnose mutarotase [bacterium]